MITPNMRLIDANAMRTDWIENGENEYVYDTNAVLDSIDSQPTIKAELVRHGYWQDGGCYEVCSVCGADHDRYNDGGYLQNFAYCPACGAKMDLED